MQTILTIVESVSSDGLCDVLMDIGIFKEGESGGSGAVFSLALACYGVYYRSMVVKSDLLSGVVVYRAVNKNQPYSGGWVVFSSR